MRGEEQEAMFSYLSPEKRVPTEHPLRRIREMVDTVLTEMSPRFARLYADVGRPSIRAGAPAAGAAVADFLLGAQRAAADGAARLQSAVPLVRGAGDGRAGDAALGMIGRSGARLRGFEPPTSGSGAVFGA